MLNIITSVILGTGVGLIVKYVLDKRYLGGVIGLTIGYVEVDGSIPSSSTIPLSTKPSFIFPTGLGTC